MGGKRQPVRVQQQDPPSALLRLTHVQFYNFVDQDVRQRLESEVSTKLRDPIVVDRWYLVLVQMKKNVESQLASAKADWKAEQMQILADLEEIEEGDDGSDLRAELYTKLGKFEKSRAGKLRFRSAVEDSLSEARILRNQLREMAAARREGVVRTALQEARIAVLDHRSHTDEPTQADKDLWAQFDELDGP